MAPPLLHVTSHKHTSCSQQQRVHYVEKKCSLFQHDLEYEIQRISNRTVINKYQTTWTSGNGNFPDLYVDEFHKILYCGVPKAGSTTIKTILASSTPSGALLYQASPKEFLNNIHYKTHLEKSGIRMLHTYSRNEQVDMLQNFTKMIVVRHPFDRLMSAYRMFVRSSSYMDKVLRYKQLYFGGRKRDMAMSDDQKLTFHDFVIVSLFDKVDRDNEHWFPYTFSCQPCKVRYNVILKQESMDKDLAYFLAKFINTGKSNIDSAMKLNSFSDKKVPQKLKSLKFFKEVETLPGRYRNLLEKRYKFDLNLFGYNSSGGVNYEECEMQT